MSLQVFQSSQTYPMKWNWILKKWVAILKIWENYSQWEVFTHMIQKLESRLSFLTLNILDFALLSSNCLNVWKLYLHFSKSWVLWFEFNSFIIKAEAGRTAIEFNHMPSKTKTQLTFFFFQLFLRSQLSKILWM